MADQVHEVEVWVLVDEDGAAVSSTDVDKLAELYDEQVGEGAEKARRCVKVTLMVPVPSYVEMKGIVPAEGEAVLTVA